QPMPYGGYSGPEPGSPRPAIIRALADLGATEAIPDLIKIMETHRHPRTRLNAADAIRRWARLDKRIVPALARMTEETHPQSQLKIIRWLVEIGDERAIPFLEKVLTGEYKKPTEAAPFAVEAMEDKTVWAEAVLALAKFGHRKIIPLLKKELPNADQEKRKAIIQALGLLGVNDTIPEMLNIIETHPEPGVRMAAATVLRKWAESDERIVPALARFAGGADEKAKLLVIRWLVETRDPRAVAFFRTTAEGDSPPAPAERVRYAAFRALIGLGDTDVIPLLKKQLADTDERQQARAARDLRLLAGDEGRKLAAETYRRHLDSKDPKIQAGAALGLGELGDDSQLDRMIALAKSLPPDGERLDVLKGLAQLGHLDGAGDLLAEIIANPKPKDWAAPIRAADFVPRINAVECIGALSDVIMNARGRWHMRYRAAAALVALGDPEGLPALLHDKVLYGRAAYGRFWVLRGLRRFKDKRVVEALTKFIEDQHQSPASRGIAAETLGAIGDADAVPALIRQLRNTDLVGTSAVLRIRAAAALAAMHAEEAMKPLAEIARDDADPDVKKAAAEALATLKSPPAETPAEEPAT
ncbi:MAG: HEAT repeat domain-containing protein, partial [Planctomycetia bacterium]|nr:HEAT repeat domain-containing protein [Planctomycetia bacterium]